MDDFYVRWLESAGIRVVPLFAYWPTEKKLDLLSKVNGALLPGGTITGQAFTDYIGNVTAIIEYALNTEGEADREEFLLWGTRQGMQVISIVINNRNEDVLKCDYEGMYPSMLPLDFTTYQPYSVMFGADASKRGIVDDLANYNTTVNYHHCGVHPSVWAPTLTANSHIISTNTDVKGKLFISSFEIVGGAQKNNIFATQYHPERAPYEFDEDAVYRLEQTLAVSNYHAMFVRQRAMRNAQRHTFGPETAETAKLIDSMVVERFPHTYDGFGGGTYWFKY